MTVVLEHSPTNQVLVYVHNSLFIINNSSVAQLLVPLKTLLNTCFFTE